jgi:hypothetical protein
VLLGECSSHPVEFLIGGGDADLEAFDLARPAACVRFFEAGEEVGVDLGEPAVLAGIGSEEGAAEAGVFVDAWGCVGAAADPELDFAFLEVGEELVPFFVGDVAILGGGAEGSPAGDERSVVFDDVTVVNGDVGLGWW